MNADSALPFGAIRRFGSAAFVLDRDSDGVALVPPACRTFVHRHPSPDRCGEYALADGALVRRIDGAVATVSADGSRLHLVPGRVVERITGRQLFAVDAGVGIYSSAMSADGRRLVVAFHDPDRDDVAEMMHDEGRFIRSVALFDIDRAVRLWEVAAPEDFDVFTAISADGRLVLIRGLVLPTAEVPDPPDAWTHVCRILDGSTGREVDQFRPRDGHCHHAFTPDRTVLYVGRESEWLVRDPKTRESVAVPPLSAAFSPDGTVVAHLDYEGSALVRRDRWTGAVIDATPCPFAHNPSVAHSRPEIHYGRDGIVTVLYHLLGRVFAWTAPDGRRRTHDVGGVPAELLGFDATGRFLLAVAVRSIADDRIVRYWDTESGAVVSETTVPASVHSVPGLRAVMTRAGPVFASPDGAAVFDPETRAWAESLPWETVAVGGCRVGLLRFRGEAVAAFVDDDVVTPVTDGTFVVVRNTPEGWLVSCLRPDRHGVAVLWANEIARGRPDPRRNEHPSDQPPAWAVVRSGDGRTVLVIHREEDRAHLLDMATGKVVGIWPAPFRAPYAAHPSREVIATASADGRSLALCGLRTGRLLSPVSSLTRPRATAWSADGARLAASLADGTILIFEAAGFLPD